MIWLAVIFLAVVMDQVTKFWIVQNVAYDTSITVIDRFFYITYISNKGAAWSILQNGRYFFIAATAVISVVLFYILFKKANDNLLKLTLALIIGGALGNLIDRIFRGGNVVDFLSFYFGSYHYPIFNIADSCVVVGTILLAYYLLFVHKEEKKGEPQ